jgi:GxxExxY protein
VYTECVSFKLIEAGLRIQKQKPIPLVFEEVKLECGFRCDILVEDKLIIEIKAVESLNDVHLAQVLTYLRLMDLKLGLLINFNVLRLKDGIKRVVNNL